MRMQRIKKATGLFLASLVFATVGSLHAEGFGIHLGFWPGEVTPELENRFFLDDLIGGFSAGGRINMPWSGKNSNTVYPLGISYSQRLGPGSLWLAANYIYYAPEYRFTGILPGPKGMGSVISLVSLDNYSTSGYEGEVGYKIDLVPEKLSITPKIGARLIQQSFDYNELTFGDAALGFSTESAYSSRALGGVIGANFQFYIIPKLSVIGDFMMSSPILGNMYGNMDFTKSIIYLAGNDFVLQKDAANADYDVDINRWALGLKYDINKQLSVNIGARTESINVSYPGYFSLPYFITKDGFAVDYIIDEIITDQIFWRQQQETKKAGLFIGLDVYL